MPMQAKAEGVKLFHAKAQLWALLGFVLMLLWFANSGTMYFMVAGDLLNPLDSIGFFKDVAMGSGRSGLQLVRSSQSLTVFSWLIPVNLCVAQFASERRARTDELFVSHGGRLSTLYRAKFGVVCGFYLLLQLAFTESALPSQPSRWELRPRSEQFCCSAQYRWEIFWCWGLSWHWRRSLHSG